MTWDSAMEQNFRFIQSTQIIFRKEENGAYLYDTVSGDLKFINPVATSIYELCDGRHQVEEMIARVAGMYQGATMDQVAKDVVGFLDDLQQRDFVRRVT